jgi:hypothetical protein
MKYESAIMMPVVTSASSDRCPHDIKYTFLRNLLKLVNSSILSCPNQNIRRLPLPHLGDPRCLLPNFTNFFLQNAAFYNLYNIQPLPKYSRWKTLQGCRLSARLKVGLTLPHYPSISTAYSSRASLLLNILRPRPF